jgi:hypothetical protein
MHRKILFRNIFASVIIAILALFLLFASTTFFKVGSIKAGSILIFIALLFLFSSIGVYSNKKGAYRVIKIFFILLIPALMIGSFLLLGREWAQRYYSLATNTPALIGTQEIILMLLLLFFISFIISLEKGQKRLSLPLDQLPANQKSATPPRKPALLTFIITVVIVVGYFLVGKRHQSVPAVPATYFEKTRVNPTLPDAENGYLQLENLIGSIENPLYDTLTLQQNTYATLTDFYAEYPEYKAPDEHTIQTYENSDFFPRLATLLEQERRKDDGLPSLLNIQGIERNLQYLSAYYAEKGELSKGVSYNILALRLADKYLSTFTSLVDGLIGTVNFTISMDATHYLLDHYDLSATDKEALREVYTQVLLTDQEEAYQRMLKGEHHTMMSLADNFEVVSDTIGNERTLDLFPFIEPFYNVKDTQKRYAYAMKEIIEKGTLADYNFEDILSHAKNAKWNGYNIWGSSVIDALLPRLSNVFPNLEKIYQQKEDILQQLQ